LKSSILKAFERKEHALAKQKLEELRELGELLKDQRVLSIFTETTQELENNIKTVYTNAVNSFNKIFDGQTNELEKSDLEFYQEQFLFIKNTEELREAFLSESCIQSDVFMLNLKSRVKAKLSTLDECKLDDGSLPMTLRKFKLLSQFYPSLYPKLPEDLKNVMKKIINQNLQTFKAKVSISNFYEAASEITSIQTSKEKLVKADLIEESTFKHVLQECKDSILELFKGKSK